MAVWIQACVKLVTGQGWIENVSLIVHMYVFTQSLNHGQDMMQSNF